MRVCSIAVQISGAVCGSGIHAKEGRFEGDTELASGFVEGGGALEAGGLFFAAVLCSFSSSATSALRWLRRPRSWRARLLKSRRNVLKKFGLDESLAGSGIFFFREQIGEFAAAHGVEAGFERGDAEKPPLGIGDGLGESFFVVGGGGELQKRAVEMVVVGVAVVGGQQERAAGEPGFDGVEERIWLCLRWCEGRY